MKDVELLAPVGSFEALKAAVQNGANAVYLGGKDFSARASANNFDRDELKEAVKYAHIRDVQVFVTANTLIKQNEIEDFIEYIKFLYDIDIDAIILQDIGMARLVKKLIPDFELHASTQMVAHSLEDVKYLENVGFDRVVLARELNVAEIKNICDNTNVDIEVFVHGALCVCYSGQCLMSSMIGNRSGNRGRCAQPCRQKYELIDINSGEIINSNGDYLLSPRDLNTIEEIDKIIDAGVHSLKIEGRMKKPEYVATVIESYRTAINEYLNEKKLNISNETINDLYTIFNRKFTKGHILGEVGKDVMNSEIPNNQGLYIGRVLDYNKKAKRLKIKLENTLKKGDGINLGGGTIGRIIKNNEITNIAHKGDTIELDFIGQARRNQIIFKTSDSELINRVQSTFQQDKENKKIDIEAEIIIKLDENPILTMSDFKGNKVTIKGDKIVEKAMNVALSAQKVETQIQKLGNTPYDLKNINVIIDNGVSLPISILNQMRRECIDELSNERIYIKNRNYKNEKVCYNPSTLNKKSNSKLRAKVKNLEQLQAALECDIDTVYYEDANTLKDALEIAFKLNKEVIYSSPRIVRNKEYKQLDKVRALDIKNVQVGTFGAMKYFKDKNLSIDYYLNAFNSETINYFKDAGVDTLCLSQELNMNEIEETLKYTDIQIESVVYGYAPMMVSEYCPMGVIVRDCKKDKRVSKCNESTYALRDFKGEQYRISQDIFCRSTIYNSKVTCMLDNLQELNKIGINIFRLDFTIENKKVVKEIIESYIEVLKNDYRLGSKATKLYNTLDDVGITTAHYYKGVE
ncbi:U32 family peptidase [Romboutsia maritimum]|uniref:U32 family peptidase n=1 Tax=Romboutsia maritimum TaxID=2020948 RepID=A0A255HY59_9FIRM|nr:U32 family peptidase [Romboutsia maritimum]RDY24129.1 U32 family peptidase [Romboutsia maritimum]